jgi:hypothetical protein
LIERRRRDDETGGDGRGSDGGRSEKDKGKGEVRER